MRNDIELDWAAYFKEFSAVHGGNPVTTGGKLLFPDGWSYSASDYKGPEWPPPKNDKERLDLILRYWAERKALLKDELYRLESTKQYLEELQLQRSAPLQQVITSYDEEAGKWKTERANVDFEGLGLRIEWLKEDLELCEQRLKEVASANV